MRPAGALVLALVAVGTGAGTGLATAAGASRAAASGFDAVVLRVNETRAEDEYAAALALIEAGRHVEALAALRRVQAVHPTFSKLSAVQTRVAVLHESRDAGDALDPFLRALDARDAGRLDEALGALDWIAANAAGSTLLDDALYLGAYLALMDGYDFPEAGARLEELAERVPESAYADSAAYLSAIVREQLGDTAGARERLAALRERHTALALPFGFRWPTGSILSRYWFDRSDRRIALIDRRLEGASRLERRTRTSGGGLAVDVNVDGIDMRLALTPSPLVAGTAWRDAGLRDRPPPTVGVYEGHVEGARDSWVRATIDGGEITGMVEVDGVRRRLLPAHLIGTLDWYQPSARRGGAPALDALDPADPDLASRLQAIDLLEAPPRDDRPAVGRRSRTALAETRTVPLSIVIDSRFDGYHAGQGLARALDYLNVADGVYRDHGLSLTLDEAVTFDDAADPMKLPAGTLETILRSFRDYRLAHGTLFGDSAATYLFTGNRKTDPTLGLAWIDTLCRSDGYDVGVTTPSSFGDVLLTHELGHSLGAQHDSDTECRDDRAGLMWPHISGATGTRLTSCSLASVRDSQGRTCLGNGVDLSLAARSTGADAVFTIANPDAAFTVSARLLVETGLPGQVTWPEGCRALTPTGGECTVGDIGPGEHREVRLALRPEAGGDAEPIVARAVPLGATELAPADNEATAEGLTLAGPAQANGLGVRGRRGRGDAGRVPMPDRRRCPERTTRTPRHRSGQREAVRAAVREAPWPSWRGRSRLAPPGLARRLTPRRLTPRQMTPRARRPGAFGTGRRSAPGRSPSVTGTRPETPSRTVPSITVLSGDSADIASSRDVASATGEPFTVVTTSRRASPASAAGLPARTSVITAPEAPGRARSGNIARSSAPMPSQPRTTRPWATMRGTTWASSSAGIAKPIPWAPPPRCSTAVVTPTRRPSGSISAPPELPGLIAASICTKCCHALPPATRRRVALTIPWVTVWPTPNGLPMASTTSPTRSGGALPSGIAGSEPASMRSTARSVSGSVPIRRPTCREPSESCTPMRAAPSTRCRFVRIVPSVPTITPEPWLVSAAAGSASGPVPVGTAAPPEARAYTLTTDGTARMMPSWKDSRGAPASRAATGAGAAARTMDGTETVDRASPGIRRQARAPTTRPATVQPDQERGGASAAARTGSGGGGGRGCVGVRRHGAIITPARREGVHPGRVEPSAQDTIERIRHASWDGRQSLRRFRGTYQWTWHRDGDQTWPSSRRRAPRRVPRAAARSVPRRACGRPRRRISNDTGVTRMSAKNDAAPRATAKDKTPPTSMRTPGRTRSTTRSRPSPRSRSTTTTRSAGDC